MPHLSDFDSITIFRPGALGDVVATRALLAWLRVTTEAKRILLAPGAQGRLLTPLADRVVDSSSTGALWLFSDDSAAPPSPLLPRGHSLAIAYTQPDRALAARFKALGHGTTLFVPPRPDRGTHVFDHLCAPVAEAYNTPFPTSLVGHLKDKGAPPVLERPMNRVYKTLAQHRLQAGRYTVLHPGSGSLSKNWPVSSFCSFAQHIKGPILVTAGEADGTAGAELQQQIGSRARLFQNPDLEDLADLLAAAAGYAGNDSGVTHLAAAVCCRAIPYRPLLALFGPSSAASWAPPEATVVQAPGPAMKELTVERVIRNWQALRHGQKGT